MTNGPMRRYELFIPATTPEDDVKRRLVQQFPNSRVVTQPQVVEGGKIDESAETEFGLLYD